ncbi:MerR family transcriptional regulator [Sinomicrobium weinanense]|uniref:MerR family transcriptional regulator n=1 Tax=Sinomicrobium weinanense TaxID=2842200 RepID=A0A926Q495_9FLAO|nr:MerR family transcriptional regulator [Sinomicrobium weinanense]MBC9798383.1 MerR family transcriptional regulator [Sinomicrobium weinanense]MBU3122151.1 MerR family transcriptional regulator [Sinomicrobium weinanense]
MKYHSVKRLAQMAGVSVRTLHHYDHIGLLKPSVRTTAGYRMYGKDGLLRLQQILFYKELGFKLSEIREVLDDPEFDLVQALQMHKYRLSEEKKRISTLMTTINQTISNLKNRKMIKPEDLYRGLPKEQAETWRKEAREKWPNQVKHGEEQLLKMSRDDFKALQDGFKANIEKLASLSSKDHTSAEVQTEIRRHYEYVMRFWGNPEGSRAEGYKGLGDLYVQDERYTEVEGVPNPAFGRFLQKAMHYFVQMEFGR